MSDQPLIDVDVHHRIGALQLAAKFAIRQPWTVIFGPSGSGKSTLLRAIAGLVRPAIGRITMLGAPVFAEPGSVWVPAHLRPVRWAGQRAELFPRKTVKWNIAMGINNRDQAFRGRSWIDELDRCLTTFGLQSLADSMPEELSGGQRQWVSVVRAAIGARGRILLLDEPFAGLDAAVRDQLIGGLRAWLGPTPIVSVTHDVAEAFLLSAEILRIADGRIVEQGPVAAVLAAERASLASVLGYTRLPQ